MKGFVRGHQEGAAAKAKEAAAELAATRRAAAKKAGSNMDRYDEILERFEGCDDDEEEEWGAICRLHDETMEDGEERILI